MNLRELQKSITICEKCPRLRKYCQQVAQVKRKSFAHDMYWGRPIPGFGDPHARLFIFGLAPAAHGANRTGRIFTGDRSGDWLFRALHRTGFANQAHSIASDDGLELRDAYISCAARCAPPDNKPSREELAACLPYLEEELRIFSAARVFVALGKLAYDQLTRAFKSSGYASGQMTGKISGRPKFQHGVEWKLPDGRLVILSYHPSQQNTFTGRLTEPMFDHIFTRAREVILKGAQQPQAKKESTKTPTK